MNDKLHMKKRLRVFDFDDTIAFTTSFIYINRPCGTKLKLTPSEYAVYDEHPEDEYDFSDFYSVNEPIEIKKITNVLKSFIDENGIVGVYILTARSQEVENAIQDYLNEIGIVGRVPVVGLQSNNPWDKAKWIESKIENENYNDIYYVDDSLKNVMAAKSMLISKQVEWEVHHVKH